MVRKNVAEILANHVTFELEAIDRMYLNFCSYFPYPAKLCLNGHEWLKRQLTHREIPFEPLDNSIRSSDQAGRVQRIADTLDAAKIDAVFANGSDDCRTRSRPRTAPLAIAVSSRSCRASSRSPKCSTDR